MIQTLIQTVAVAVATVTMPTVQSELPTTPIQVTEERVYIVQKGDTLSLLSEKFYNNTDAWASIYKDNPQVKNPDVLEEGTVLKIRYVPQVVDEETLASLVPEKMHDSVSFEATESAVVVTESVSTPTIPPAIQVTNGPLTEAQLTYLGNCEAGMDPTKNTGNGYYGAFQFSYGTWKSMNTGYERADLAPIEVQKDAVQRLLQRSSIFTQFPGCARKMQAEGII